MEFFIGLIFLISIGWVVKKLLPLIWFLILFIGALLVLLLWQGVLEASGSGIFLGIIGTITAAWKFALRKK